MSAPTGGADPKPSFGFLVLVTPNTFSVLLVYIIEEGKKFSALACLFFFLNFISIFF